MSYIVKLRVQSIKSQREEESTAVTRNNKHVSAAAELYQLYLRGVGRLDI